MEEFSKTLSELYRDLQDGEVQELVRYLDKDGDNMIDYDEFLEIYDFEAHNPTKKVHGSIDRMTKLLQQHFERLTREGVDPEDVFTSFDADGNGKISVQVRRNRP